MDPLSLTASIIAVIGAGAAVAKCVRKLACVKDAPNAVLQLDAEITDVRLVVSMIKERCRPRDKPSLSENEDNNIICNTLQRTKDIVLELDILLRYGLTKITTKGEKIDVIAWMRTESKVHALKERLRNVKIDLIVAIGIMNMSSLHRLEAGFQQNRFPNDSQPGSSCTTELQTYTIINPAEPHREPNSRFQTTETHAKNTHYVDKGIPTETRATIFTNEPDSELTLLSRRQDAAANLRIPELGTYKPTLVDLARPVLFSPLSEAALVKPLMDVKSLPGMTTDIESLPKPETKICNSLCLCTCHNQVQRRSPKILKALLGSLSVVYSSLLLMKPECDDPNCQIKEVSNVKAAYTLPRWFFSQVVVIQGIYTQSRGPELLLRVLRVRPNNSKIFTAIKDKNIVVIQRLLSTGEASVLDIDKRGRSLLHLALYSRQDPHEACRVLLAAGADMMQEDEKLISSYMHVWMQIHQEVLSHDPSAQPPIGGLFGIKPDLERFGLPEIHAAVLGYGHKTFNEVLVSLPRSSINDQDRMGYTALSLATQGGDRYMTERLLLKGADPRIADQYGRTPIFFWIRAVPGTADLNIIDLLADKESINHKDDMGMTILHYAIRLKRDWLLEHLKTRGIDVNCRGHSNWTPLHEAVVRKADSTIVINWLLDNGADVSLQDSYSRTPLMTAAKKRKHRALKLLLNRGVDYTFSTKLKRNLLHLVAIHGDLEVLEVLNHADLHLLSTDGKDSEGFTPMRLAVWRRNNNALWSKWSLREPDEDPRRWFDTFETLCRRIEETRASVTSPNEEASDCSNIRDNNGLTQYRDEGSRRLPGSYPNH
ncbi:hypothetical protein MMC18_004087 [Xylographa bjoerkii]|nr:hypothetical protein [Xylographa bjoerkii]